MAGTPVRDSTSLAVNIGVSLEAMAVSVMGWTSGGNRSEGWTLKLEVCGLEVLFEACTSNLCIEPVRVMKGCTKFDAGLSKLKRLYVQSLYNVNPT